MNDTPTYEFTLDQDAIAEDCYENADINDCGDLVGYSWLGTEFGLVPASVYAEDALEDEYDIWESQLQGALEDAGFYLVVEAGEYFASMLLDAAGEFVTTADGGASFQHGGETIAQSDQELLEVFEAQQYWPNVVSLSDHGNVSLYSLSL